MASRTRLALLVLPVLLTLAAAWLMLSSAAESRNYGGRIGVLTYDCGRAVEHPVGFQTSNRMPIVWTARPNADPYFLQDECTKNLRARSATATGLVLLAGVTPLVVGKRFRTKPVERDSVPV